MPRGASRIDKVRKAIRVRHYSARTGQARVGWSRRCIAFDGRGYPRQMGEGWIEAFVSDRTAAEQVAASMHNQAFNALFFLGAAVLVRPPGAIDGVVRGER